MEVSAISLNSMNFFDQFLRLHRLSSVFHQHSHHGMPIVIYLHLSLSDYRHLNPTRLFTPMICLDLGISQITTNPFATTFLTKAMKRVAGNNSDVSDHDLFTVMNRNLKCRDAELTEIAKIADGDLRKALIILNLRLRFGKGNAYDKADSPISVYNRYLLMDE